MTRADLPIELFAQLPINPPPLCEQFTGVKQKIDIGDCKIYCEIEGNGVPVVLLHGGPGATHHYFHRSFSKASKFAKVIYFDQRGCGSSEYNPGDGYSISQAVDDLKKLKNSLGIKQWFVLGHSYGGLLAQRYALKYPEGVLGLILVCAEPGMSFFW